MEEPPFLCAKCHAPMEQGFIVGLNMYGQIVQSEWAAGPPVKSFWTGITLRGTRRYPIYTYRCTASGYLESYAFTPKT